MRLWLQTHNSKRRNTEEQVQQVGGNGERLDNTKTGKERMKMEVVFEELENSLPKLSHYQKKEKKSQFWQKSCVVLSNFPSYTGKNK